MEVVAEADNERVLLDELDETLILNVRRSRHPHIDAIPRDNRRPLLRNTFLHMKI